MRQIKGGGGAVSYGPGRGGVLLAKYEGLITGPQLVQLRTAVIADTPETRAFVVRFDSAALLMGVDPLLPEAGNYDAIPDGAVVCRHDQLDVVRAYARYMAERGVIRAVFLDSEISQAMRFALRHVDALQRR